LQETPSSTSFDFGSDERAQQHRARSGKRSGISVQSTLSEVLRLVYGQNDRSVSDYIASLDDEQTIRDCQVLIEMMQRVNGCDPQMWNVGTIGFGAYHYKYDSGREGDNQIIGFYSRKDKTTIYRMDGTVRHTELLARLGKHITSRVCAYIKRLSDIQLLILEQIVQHSHECVKSQDGHMHRAFE
jgi:hypothetical protein